MRFDPFPFFCIWEMNLSDFVNVFIAEQIFSIYPGIITAVHEVWCIYPIDSNNNNNKKTTLFTQNGKLYSRHLDQKKNSNCDKFQPWYLLKNSQNAINLFFILQKFIQVKIHERQIKTKSILLTFYKSLFINKLNTNCCEHIWSR